MTEYVEYNKKHFKEHDDFIRFMQKGGIGKLKTRVTHDSLKNVHPDIRAHYKTVLTSRNWRDQGNMFCIGGESMKSVLYNTVFLLRVMGMDFGHRISRTGMVSIVDAYNNREPRAPSFQYNSEELKRVFRSPDMLAITDFVDSPIPKSKGGFNCITEEEWDVITDALEYRATNGYPTMIHSPHPIKVLGDVLPSRTIEFIKQSYVEYDDGGKIG